MHFLPYLYLLPFSSPIFLSHPFHFISCIVVSVPLPSSLQSHLYPVCLCIQVHTYLAMPVLSRFSVYHMARYPLWHASQTYIELAFVYEIKDEFVYIRTN